MRRARAVARLAVWCVYLLFAAGALWLSISRPFNNWDIVGYIGAVNSFDGDDAAKNQTSTYTELRRVLPEGLYDDITRAKSDATDGATRYRRAVSSDPTAFAEQLPFYQIRPLYTGLIYALRAAGVDAEFATYAISGVAVAFGLMILCAAALPRIGFSALLLPLFATQIGLFDLARFSTADGLAFLLVMSALWCYVNARLPALLALLVVVLAVRTDLILFSAPLLCVLFLTDPMHRRAIAAAGVASLGVYVAIVRHWHNQGWPTFFYCTLVQRCAHPLTNPPSLTVQNYLDALARGWPRLVADPAFCIYLLILGAAAAIYLRQRPRAGLHAGVGRAVILIGVCAAYAIARFFVLPAEWERAFPMVYVLSAFALLWLVVGRNSDEPA